MRSAGRTRVIAREAHVFVGLLARLTKCGVSLPQAIDIASKELKDSSVKQAIARVRKRVEGGNPLSGAFSAESQLFPRSYVAAISEGEKSGNVPSVLKAISEEIEESIEARKLIRRIRLYRALAIGGGIAAILVGVFGILPFALGPARATAELWDGFDTTLPATGFSFFWPIGKFVSEHPVTVVLLLFGFLGLLLLPFHGRSLRSADLRVFCNILGRNLKWGMPLGEALKAARKAVPSRLLEREVGKVADRMERGASLSESMKGSLWFPWSLLRAAAAGESQGQLAGALLDMADFYRQESERASEKLARRAIAVPAVLTAIFAVFCLVSAIITVITLVGPLRGSG